ncbi:MAG: hypothetical protein WCK90_00360 [archaeon]
MASRENYLNQLADYIKKNLKRGYTLDSLRWALVGQGHSKMEVDKAMKIVEQDLASDAPVLETRPEIRYEIIEPKPEPKKPWYKRILGL